MPFEFKKASLEGIILIQPRRFSDTRGSFEECYHLRDFAAHSIPDAFVQDNTSFSIKNTIRGQHFQKAPHGQAKLVKVLAGRVLDVAVDIREKSNTYGQHIAVEISSDTGNMIYIPEGFAHGFSVLSDSAIVHYKTTSYYHPDSEAGVSYQDPELGIDWKITDPFVSPKDSELPLLRELKPSILPKDAAAQS